MTCSLQKVDQNKVYHSPHLSYIGRMQTILGAGGVIGRGLAANLLSFTDQIRLVARNPKKVNESDSLFAADLSDRNQVMAAVEGSEVAYLTVGLPYDTAVWQTAWPEIMRNTIDACKEHGARLVFFDNVYMYDKDHLSPMTEDTPVNPPSKKGRVRAEIAQMLMDEVSTGNLTALIARAADFYGPGNDNSVLMIAVYDNFIKGKKANWLGSVNCRHSFTFTPDAGKATAILGNTEDAFNQIWHLPTAPNPLTGREWIEAFAREMNVQPKYQVAGQTLTRIIGLFNPMMKELSEMVYQYDREYVFDSAKFEKRFDFKPTSYKEGLKLSL